MAIKEVYLGNQNLKAAGVAIPWTAETFSEFTKCSQDPIYFCENYVKIVSVDKGLINFEMWPFQKEMMLNMVHNRFSIAKMPRQVGKALDIETPILTDNGFVLLKNLSVGDTIYGPDGKKTKITFITNVMNNRPCYLVTFSNGDTIVADEEHLWEINSADWRTGSRTLTTKEIIPFLSHTNRPYIKFTEAIQFDKSDLIVDPYLFGVWIGDGNSADGRITCHIDDLEYYKTKFDIKNTYYDKRNLNVSYNNISGLTTKLKTLGVINNKHIPEKYMFSSIEQRLELVRGLMDTDGSVRKHNGGCEFYQKNESLIDQIRYILSSLGIKSTKISKIVNGRIYYSINFTTNLSVFNLPRKKTLQYCKSHPKNNRLYFDSINSVDSVPVRCLQVDNEDHLFLAGNTLIPTHNTTVTAATILWHILFSPSYRVAILANKESQSIEILNRIKDAYEFLPQWMQQGVLEWNKKSIVLENGSKVMCAATSSSAIRGQSMNMIYLDEFAFVPTNVQENFFASVYPTISSGQSTKVIITSTPNGFNLFYKIWHDSEEGRNNYVRSNVHWSSVPGRDEKWRVETVQNTSEKQFRVEFECEFLGSSNTLIDAGKLQKMVYKTPIRNMDDTNIYFAPEHKHNYIITVDVARGVEGDYSAFVIYDVTSYPYGVVACYKSNEISPLLYPNKIYTAARAYNDAVVLVEVNDIGQQVADILYNDLEYEGVLVTQNKGRGGQRIGGGFGGGRPQMGVKTTKQVKRIGCSNLKTLIENDKLIVNDYDIFYELTRFIEIKDSYEAESGSHDDLVMCCVLFAWLVNQSYFKELFTTDVRGQLLDDNRSIIDDAGLTFGFINNHYEEDTYIQTDSEFNNLDFHPRPYNDDFL